MPKVRTSVVCLKASDADSTWLPSRVANMSLGRSPHRQQCFRSSLPTRVANNYSGLLTQEATSKRGYIISQFAVSTSELGRAYVGPIVRQRATSLLYCFGQYWNVTTATFICIVVNAPLVRRLIIEDNKWDIGLESSNRAYIAGVLLVNLCPPKAV